MRLVQLMAQFDLDLGGEREQVEVGGVEEWLTHLGRGDFYQPEIEEDFRAVENGGPEGASGLKSYSSILFNRHLPGQSDLATSVDAPNLEDPVAYLSIESACDEPYVEFRFACIQREDVWPIYTLFGEAISLQWNRECVHYILIAPDMGPITVNDLFKMANSMIQSDPPFPHDRNWLRALRVSLGD